MFLDTHNTPQLMATATPIFSFSFICRFQITVQGRRARHKSIAPEYAATPREKSALITLVPLRSAFAMTGPSRRRRTSREHVIIGHDVGLPALARRQRKPRLLDGRALDPVEQRAEPHGDVHGDDDEPEHPLHPALGQPQQRKGEARLGPDRRRQRAGARRVDQYEHDGAVLGNHRPVVPVTAVAVYLRLRKARAFAREADLVFPHTG